MERAQHLPGGGLVENELARVVAGAQQVGGDASPVDVHVDRERGGRGVVGQPAKQSCVLVEPGAATAELGRDGDVEKARGAQLGEVLVEESVLAVVDRGSFVEPASISASSTSAGVEARSTGWVVVIGLWFLPDLPVTAAIGGTGTNQLTGIGGMYCSTGTITSAGIPARAAASRIASALGAS